MNDSGAAPASSVDRLFAGLQSWLPQHWLSARMHALARSRNPTTRRWLIRTVLHLYPQIRMSEAAEPDPYAYESFNAFFTRALRAGARPLAPGDRTVVSPVDGSVSQCGRIDDGRLIQAKGRHYAVDALLADPSAHARYGTGRFACLYLAPYDYHRIHMPCSGRLVRTRYVPGKLFSVNQATARTVPGLFALNERVVCEFDSALGPVAVVMVGALLVGSIETVFAGEINPPSQPSRAVRELADGIGREFAKGEELGRFNMGSTVIVVLADPALELAPGIRPDETVRLGQALARG
jgi:phosphatidylserine decarboxylase